MINLSSVFRMSLALALLAISAGALASEPIKPVDHVDMSRYMGRWFVIASIPTSVGDDAYNMVETYRRMDNGDVCTSLWFHDGGPDASIEKKHRVATVRDDTGNAEWKVHVFLFFHAQYIVGWLNSDYSQVIVARDKRDHTWLMARTPSISDADYQAMVKRVKDMGYDTSELRRMPQDWSDADPDAMSFAESCD